MTSTYRALAPLVHDELARADAAMRSRDLEAAWSALERAHILSQPSARLHTRAHWEMLLLALRCRDARETWGQWLRLAGGWLGSLVGRYPLGNTGRATVSMFAPMTMPDDLRAMLAALGMPAGSDDGRRGDRHASSMAIDSSSRVRRRSG